MHVHLLCRDKYCSDRFFLSGMIVVPTGVFRVLFVVNARTMLPIAMSLLISTCQISQFARVRAGTSWLFALASADGGKSSAGRGRKMRWDAAFAWCLCERAEEWSVDTARRKTGWRLGAGGRLGDGIYLQQRCQSIGLHLLTLCLSLSKVALPLPLSLRPCMRLPARLRPLDACDLPQSAPDTLHFTLCSPRSRAPSPTTVRQ